MRTRSRLVAALTAATILALSGCGVSIPADPDGTLQSVQGAQLRAGVTPNGDLVTLEDGEPAGDEVDAIRAFARSMDAEVEWTVGSEETLMRGLEEHRLDLVAGGLTDETPWVDKAGVTRSYREVTDTDGRTHKLVMLVPLGENAFLSELERFLADYVETEAGS